MTDHTTDLRAREGERASRAVPARKYRTSAEAHTDLDRKVREALPFGDVAVDFVVEDSHFQNGSEFAPRYRLAIELDGHDFHERTKEQAQRDKARDRALTEAGYRVLRFTGSEVWRDAGKCVDEVLRVAKSLVPKEA